MLAGRKGWRTTFLDSIRGTFRFSGRSTFSELAIYWISAILIAMAVNVPLLALLETNTQRMVWEVIECVLYLPLPALLIRRLHDQDRSGHYLWLAAPGVALWATRKLVSETQGIDRRVAFDAMTWPLDWAATLASLVLLFLMFFSGTSGPNRFGSEPNQPAPDPAS